MRDVADAAIVGGRNSVPQRPDLAASPTDRTHLAEWSATALECITLMLATSAVRTTSRLERVNSSLILLGNACPQLCSERGYKPGKDVLTGGLNWSQDAVDKVLDGEMVVTHGGHFLLGAWAMIVLRDTHDGRDFAEEDVRLQFPMGAIDLPVARRFPEIGKVDWRKVDFTKFSKTRNAAVSRYQFTTDAVLANLAH